MYKGGTPLNVIRQTFPVEISHLRPLLSEAYQRIAAYQNARDLAHETAMREAIARTLPILSGFKRHLPHYKRRYIEVLEHPENLAPRDLVICFDRGIYELHIRVTSGQWAALPWSRELRDILSARQETEVQPDAADRDDVFLTSGVGASSGEAEGIACLVFGRADFAKIQPGQIMVAPMTEPDFIEAASRIAGLITDRGGLLCHAAILAREFHIPCIVGCHNATTVIRDGDVVHLDGLTGIVLRIDPQ